MGLVMILSATLNADVRQYHFSHLTMDDGLSHNDITAIIQDAYGFMWFATRDGLNRYDGNKVKVYKSECSPNNSQGINSIFHYAWLQTVHFGWVLKVSFVMILKEIL